MPSLDLLIEAWDMAHFELGEAFQGMPDEDLWRRPHPHLLSVGELAAHIAYWEIEGIAGEGVQSPLLDGVFRYYTSSVAEPAALRLGAAELHAEVQRVYQAAKAVVLAQPRDSEDRNSFRDWTWGYSLMYAAFHCGYHTGQIYSVRHLLGHTPVDN